MKQLSAIFMAMLIGTQAFLNVGVLAFWLAHRAEIAATQCENRNRPELKCDGKCFLKKNLNIESTSSTTNSDLKHKPLQLKKSLEIVALEAENCVFHFEKSTGEDAPLLICMKNWANRLFGKTIFHPPSC